MLQSQHIRRSPRCFSGGGLTINTQKIAAIYCRLSKEDLDKSNRSDDSESIQNQKLLLIDYASKNGFLIYKVYVDEDLSGFSDRPSFKQMIKDAADGQFSIILCKHQSRFTRDMELVERYIHGYFVEWGIRFISLTDNVDTNVRGNKKARQINGLINEWFSEDLSENIRTVFKRKMEAGQFLGAFACYGYAKDPENRHKLIIDEDAAKIVREIFSLYLSGYGANRISLLLTARGIPTPTQYKQLKGLNFANPNSDSYSIKHGAWPYGTIKSILKNEAYIGTLIQGRERKVSYKSKKVVIAPKSEWIVVDDNHPPIIEKQTFYTVQSLLAKKRKAHLPHTGYKNGEHAHPLSGKVLCLDCGSVLHRGATARDGKTHYLRCKLAYKTKSQACTPHTIKLDEVLRVVEEKIRALINSYINNDENYEALVNSFSRQNDSTSLVESKEKELRVCESKILEFSRIVTSAYVDKVKGILSEDDFVNMKGILDKDMETYQKKKNCLEREITEMSLCQKSVQNVSDLIKKYASLNTVTHEIINDFIDNVQIGEKDKSNGVQEVVINWLF